MKKEAQNFNRQPRLCPSCGAMLYVLTSELRQCPNRCPGAVWDPVCGWDPAAEEASRDNTMEREHRERKAHPLQPVADRLGYSLRQTTTLVEHRQVPGVTYAEGVAHVSSHGFAWVAVIPEDWKRFTLPRETDAVATEVCSSAVASGFICVRTDIASGKLSRHIDVRAEPGHSGLLFGVVCFDKKGEPIPPPSIP